MHKSEDRLRIDLDRLAERVYSEEGIAMFLACEDLTSDQTEGDPVFTLKAINKNLASAIQRDASALQRIRPDAPLTDAAKIVEMLADRDFAAGGTGTDL